MNSMDQMKEFDLEEISQSKNASIETENEGIPADHWNVSKISAGLKDSKNNEESNLIEGQEKVDIIQDILLKMYLQQFKS